MRFGSAWSGANFHVVDKGAEITSDIHLIAMAPDKPGTLVGCSHPGIEKVVKAATAIDPRIHLIVGGFHLVASSDGDIEKIVRALRDRFKVEYVAPGHCTGEPALCGAQEGVRRPVSLRRARYNICAHGFAEAKADSRYAVLVGNSSPLVSWPVIFSDYSCLMDR